MSLVTFPACQGRAERLAAESREHLLQAVMILEQAGGDTDKAVDGLESYLQKHRDAMIRVRTEGAEAMRALSPEDRERFAKAALEKVLPVRERLDTLVRTFPEPARVVKKLQEFL